MKKSIILLIVAFSMAKAHSQSIERFVIASAGNSFSNADLQVDYTIGEAVTTTLSGGGNRVTQGFHQPTEVSVGITSFKQELLKLEAFPNPTQSTLSLSFTTSSPIEFTATVYDVTLRKTGIEITDLATSKWSSTLDVNLLSAGSYFIHITNLQNQSIGLLKFQKVLY